MLRHRQKTYDGKAAFEGVCINDFIETGTDLLNPLANILARFRLGKFAMMADLTKCFFQIGVPAEQRDLFRILWFDKTMLGKKMWLLIGLLVILGE